MTVFRSLILAFLGTWLAHLPMTYGQDHREPTWRNDPQVYQVGVSRIDITPDYPVRLSGFGGRRQESEGVRQPIFVKCLALSDRPDAIHLLLTVDNLGLPNSMRLGLNAKLREAGFAIASISISATHTHTAPMLTGVVPTLFGTEIPVDHQRNIDRYTQSLSDWMHQAAVAAIQSMEPCTLQCGVGMASFAANRRTAGGPVDHDLPVLIVRDRNQKVRAIWTSYACHCVTLSDNRISGDWAGYAQEAIERRFPGAIGMVAIGCGADSNPSSGVTGDRADVAALQGAEIADSIATMMDGHLASIRGTIRSESELIELKLQPVPTRSHWVELGQRSDAIGYHARYQIAALDQGRSLPTKLPFEVQSLTFGDSLAMLFLPGEVVVDYSLRLKKFYDSSRVWIHAYSNDSPCYIPSERILREGGYEGGGAMVYYNVPAPFQPGLEDQIIEAIEKTLPSKYRRRFNPEQTLGSVPSPPQKAALLAKVDDGLKVELVASEPLVQSPVAIDFGPDGRLWVAEMSDYPNGPSGQFEPGGRIRVLRDADGDGKMDRSTVFTQDLPFPTGVTVWRKGLLVCAAPDILYFPDEDEDDIADRRIVIATGFGTENYQARVNSLEYSLDGWLYGSCGLFGGTIRDGKGNLICELGDRDFRLNPDLNLMEPATGRTQQGRVRNDFDDWFGCDNSDLGRHYPIPDHYLKRNPFLAPRMTTVHLLSSPQGSQLFPATSGAQRFQLSGPLGRPTAACGIGIYRDSLLGPSYTGNLFTCEPVNLLVHRMILDKRRSTFEGARSPGNEASEFLASTDPWFRPVQARTGPDGGLWIVDMCRYIIEHPRWIPESDLKKLDARAGHDLGRIYRILPKNHDRRQGWSIGELPLEKLAERLESPNGWQRDMAFQQLLWAWNSQGPSSSLAPTTKRAIVESIQPRLASPSEITRISALCLLDQLGFLGDVELASAISDPSPEVRRQAIRLTESRWKNGKLRTVSNSIRAAARDDSRRVQTQLAFSLGEIADPEAGQILFHLALSDPTDDILQSAIDSSLGASQLSGFVDEWLQSHGHRSPIDSRLDLPSRMIRTAVGLNESNLVRSLFLPALDRLEHSVDWSSDLVDLDLQVVESVLASQEYLAESIWSPEIGVRFSQFLENGRAIALDERADRQQRSKSLKLLGYLPQHRQADLEALISLLLPNSSLGDVAMDRLAKCNDSLLPERLVSEWKNWTPAIQSRALEVLLSRPQWHPELIAAFENRKIDLRSIPSQQRQLLLSTVQGESKVKLDLLLSQDLAHGHSNRQEVIDDYLDKMSRLQGDVELGRALYKKKCSLCHRLDQQGHSVGPDLDMVAPKSLAFLTTEILDPNRNLDSRYVQYIALANDGQITVGLLTENAVSIILRGQEGKETTILRKDLQAIRPSGKSLMPEGLEQEFSPQDLSDLVAFLRNAPIPFKSLEGNQPETIRSHERIWTLRASQAEIRGTDIQFEQPFQNIGYWHGRDDSATWQVECQTPVLCDVYLDYACENSAGNRMAIEYLDQRIDWKVDSTGSWSHYRQVKIGQFQLSAQRSPVIVQAIGELLGPLLDLRTIFFVPEGMALPGEQRADRMLAAIVEKIGDDQESQYRAIPQIWKLAIDATRTGDVSTIKGLLSVGLPELNGRLLDWQAVVIGGSVINGVSLDGHWPKRRLEEILASDPTLAGRWKKAIDLAFEMQADIHVPTGTRYDALRMVAMQGGERAIGVLTPYLQAGIDDELQMGAISGLSDMELEEVADLLIGGLSHFSEPNRRLAVSALYRNESRTAKLQLALREGRVNRDWLDP